jgi:hypothetical protein
MAHTHCPICRDGVLTRSEGRLDQSGDSYLPTVVWTCERCEYTRYEPALHARWRPGAEPDLAAPVAAQAVARRAA